MSAFGAYQKAQADKSAMQAQAATADNNAELAELQAQDALRRGSVDQVNSDLKYAGAKGSQRAAMSANGIDITEGSAVDTLATTDYARNTDAATIQDNALRSAWGYRVQSANLKTNAENLRRGADGISPGYSAATSLLGSASSVAGSWYQGSKAGVGTTK